MYIPHNSGKLFLCYNDSSTILAPPHVIWGPSTIDNILSVVFSHLYSFSLQQAHYFRKFKFENGLFFIVLQFTVMEEKCLAEDLCWPGFEDMLDSPREYRVNSSSREKSKNKDYFVCLLVSLFHKFESNIKHQVFFLLL